MCNVRATSTVNAVKYPRGAGLVLVWCWFGAGLVFIEPAFSPVRDVAEAKERHVDQEFARQNFRHCERVGCT